MLVSRIEEKVEGLLGKPLKRKEDPRFITGTSRYVDDIKLPGMLFASVVRSPYGHARINSVDVTAALANPKVRLILTGKEVKKRVETMPVTRPTENRKSVPRPVLAIETVNYQGEAVAFVVAETRYAAEDAAEQVSVDYTSLPAVVDMEKALDDNSVKVHESLQDNIANHYVKSQGDVEGVFKEAEKVVKVSMLNQRVAPSPMESRAVLADFDSGTGILTLWLSTQSPFETKSALADILGMDENKLRVIAPDVGGAFGAKISLYPEDILVSLASIELHRPVKWVETRSETFATMTHGRGQKQIVEAAVKKDGTILGLKAKIIADIGAYPTEEAVAGPEITVDMVPALYDLNCFKVELFCVLTNKVPFDAYRGAGRPEATYLVERTVHRVATELGIDSTEVRLKNFIPKERFPFKTISGLEYDSGDYETNLKKALELSEYNKWRVEQRRARGGNNGRLIGVGISSFVEICSFAPDFPESASLYVSRTGKITVIPGTSPHGQGHETPFAQIVADELGVALDDIVVTYGDTAQLPYGTFTAGSRSAALGGTAVLMCAKKVKEKMAEIAGHILEVDPSTLSFENGKIFQKHNPNDKSIAFAKVAKTAYIPSRLPKGMEPALYAFSVYAPPDCTYPFGTHVAVVEVERETGLVKILDYVAVDDVGKVLNPMVVEGQAHGGIMQGAGQALLEEVVYDENGQLLTSSFLDYQIPVAGDVLPIRWSRTETPSPLNPLGAKGVGEVGAIACPPAIVNAVEDALSPFGVKVDRMPLTPTYILNLLSENGQNKKTASG
jgi:carbon-monoxide dehydrogenase large subunit